MIANPSYLTLSIFVWIRKVPNIGDTCYMWQEGRLDKDQSQEVRFLWMWPRMSHPEGNSPSLFTPWYKEDFSTWGRNQQLLPPPYLWTGSWPDWLGPTAPTSTPIWKAPKPSKFRPLFSLKENTSCEYWLSVLLLVCVIYFTSHLK